jgi:hypothetical protein
MTGSAKQSRMHLRVHSGLRPPSLFEIRRTRRRWRSSQRQGTLPHPRSRICPGFYVSHHPQKEEGAGNAGCWPHPRALRAKESALYARKQRQGSQNNRHPLRNGFTAYTRSPRGTGLVSPRHWQIIFRQLDPSVGGSGPHDFAVREAVFVGAPWRAETPHVHRIPLPTSVTIAKRPSGGGGTR